MDRYYIIAYTEDFEPYELHSSNSLENACSVFGSLFADEKLPLIELYESTEDDDIRLAYTEFFNNESQKNFFSREVAEMAERSKS